MTDDKTLEQFVRRLAKAKEYLRSTGLGWEGYYLSNCWKDEAILWVEKLDKQETK
jgi:hypothetical protein